MGIIIGGSPSTGSSLLARILNRHSMIFCGPETYLFTKSSLYEHWNRDRHRLLRKGIFGLRSPGWHMFNGVEIEQAEFGWSRRELKQLIRSCHALDEFATLFFARPMRRDEKVIWAEKTPSNSYCFELSRLHMAKTKTILIVRDPFECIASMILRGLSSFHAVCLYLCNTFVGLKVPPDEFHLILKYEALVNDPEKIVERCCTFIGVNYEKSMLKPEQKDIKMKGWRFKENAEVSKTQGSRFAELSKRDQQDVIYLSKNLRINTNFQFYHTLGCENICDLARQLEYPERKPTPSIHRSNFRIAMYEDRVWRSLRGYPTGWMNYPVILNSKQ